ncbi:MAG: hypothetical protein OEY14_08990, partial [Myxococcales bacterium]|nr:hypothetical protein [Myxococcales bacterium]
EGAPFWLPIDASTTQQGRPLRVARRPPGKFRAPRDREAKAPAAPPRLSERRPSRRRGTGRDGAAGRGSTRSSPKKARPPRAELLRVLRHLERLTGRALSDEERQELRQMLDDPRAAEALLRRLRGR